MSESVVVPWVPLAAVAAGAVAIVVVTRGAAAAVHLVADEVSYRAGSGDLGALAKWLR